MDAVPPRPASLWRWAIAVLGLDIFLAVGVTAPVWANPTRLYGGGDQRLFLSFWSLTQQAIGALHNPFFTTRLNAPDGVNLAWNTSTPLLAVISWPIRELLGPVGAWNLLVLVGLALSAWLGSIAIHRLVPGRLAATVGGILYGFSPFVTAQARAHIHVALLVTPPLLLLLLERIALRPRGRWWTNGALLGATLAVEFYISEEVTFIEVIGLAVTGLVLAVLHRDRVRRVLGAVVRTTAVAAAVLLAGVAYPLATQLAGPQRPAGPVQHSEEFVSNILNAVVPTPYEAIAPGVAPLSHTFSGNYFEATAYLGLPLLILLAVLLLGQRRDPRLRAAALVAALLWILSLGAHPAVGDLSLAAIPLPWAAVANLPLVQDLLPVRLTLLMYLALGVAVAAGLHAARHTGTARRLAVGALTAAVLASFAPSLPAVAPVEVPAFFSGDVARVPAGSTVLVAPVPVALEANAQLWQAYAGSRFAIVGGAYLGPDSGRPRTMPRLFALLRAAGEGGAPASLAPAELPALRAELHATAVHTVVLGPAAHAAALRAVLTALCAASPAHDQGVLVWWRC